MKTAITGKIKIGNYQDIIHQLGGNKFLAMTGSKIKYYGYDDNGYVYLMVELVKNQSRAKYLKIQLNGKDLYNLEFSRIKKTLNKEYAAYGIKIYDEKKEVVKIYKDVFCDSLQDMFTNTTGLLTRLY